MKKVSLFQEALRCAEQNGAVKNLGDVANVSRREFDECETFCFRTQVPCMEYISLLIENAILLRTNRAGRVYAGFEKLARMEAIADRYLRIADVSERVYIFGVDDWRPPKHPNMRIISVSEQEPLSREWFVVANSSTLKVALIGVDEEGLDSPVLEARHFSAIKTSDPAVIARLSDRIEEIVDSYLLS